MTSQNSTHTPGPWTVRRLRHGTKDYDIYSITGQGWADGHRTIAEIGDWLDRPEGNAEADTKLLAAAPDMLKALEAARDDLRDYGAVPIQQVRDNITTAIEAAK